MSEADLHERITQIEAQIAQLAEVRERCRKFMRAAQALILIGGLGLAAIVLGVLRGDALPLIGATTCVIGGIVLLGSNDSTAKQTTDKIAAAEALRAQLIEQIELQLVREAGVNTSPWLH